MEPVKVDFNVINHGVDNTQYFTSPGCGKHEHVVTGTGGHAVEAYDDAVDQVYSAADALGIESIVWPNKPPHGINKQCKVPAKDWKQDECDLYVHVSIQFTFLD